MRLVVAAAGSGIEPPPSRITEGMPESLLVAGSSVLLEHAVDSRRKQSVVVRVIPSQR